MELGTHPYLLVNRRYCPHCNKNLSLKTYKAHKRLYFDRVTKEWRTTDIVTPTRPVLDVLSSDTEPSNSDEESPPNSEEDSEIEFFRQSSPPQMSHEGLPTECQFASK